MKTASFILLCLMLILLNSCNNDRKRQFVPEISVHAKLMANKKKVVELWKKAIDKGDFKAYNEVSNAYLLESQIYELYYYSLIMANKYQCPEAYYHLFVVMNDKVSIDGLVLYSNDEMTKNMSFYYLLKASELGYAQAQYKIDEVFGKGKSVPNSSYFIKQLVIHENSK